MNPFDQSAPGPGAQWPVLFTDPWLLAALPALAALLVAARLPWWRAARRAGRRAVRQEATRLAVRLLWLSFLVLALSGLTLVRPLDRQSLLFVLDASSSMAPVRDQSETAVRTAAEGLRGGDRLGVVATAAGSQVEEMPQASPLFTRLGTTLPGSATDLASGLRLAGAMVGEGYTGRAVLVSDGRQTRGDVVAAARELAARGTTVDVLAMGAAVGADVRLESVQLSDVAYQGEVSSLLARVYSDRAVAASARVYQDDRLLLERGIDLRPGRQEVVLPVPAGDPGLHRYRVDVSATDPSADATPANNSLGAVQRVLGPPRVLVVAQRPEAAGMLTTLLPAAGVDVSISQPSRVPADLAGWARYDSVILADVPVASLPSGAMDLLEKYVRDLGRGLVMTGGPDSFGPGGYEGTPVERALPVYMDLKGRGRQPKVALVLIIDKSGSMSGTKVEMAKEAAARSLRLLRSDDRAAVLAFDTVPQWVAPLTPLAERERLERAVGTIYAGGGTEIFPALSAGFYALRDVQADVKHLILMTDGRSATGGDYGRLTQELREARVTLSTVGVGADADTGLLEAMARAGRGRYHFTADPGDIPQIFAQETMMATRTLLVDARFYPAAASASPLLRGLTSTPPLDGYVAVTPKEQAEVVLVSPDGDPVFASWQYGLGRAAAWTPDVGGRWSGAWAGSPSSTTLWGNLLSWLLPPAQEGEISVRVEVEGERELALVAENRGGWEEVRPTRASLLGPGGQRREVDLAPSGPGRYQARVEVPEPGAYVVQVTQPAGEGAELRGETGWVAPYPAEFREMGVDRGLLAQVAAAGGGRVLAGPAEAVGPAKRTTTARWPAGPLLLVLAALLWPLEIASRRLLVPAASTWLPVRAGSRVIRPSAEPDQTVRVPGRRGKATPSEEAAPASETTRRLLDRKRAFRETKK